MKYGILFTAVSALLTATAIMHGGWYLLYLWPACSFGSIAAGYLGLGTRVYGKSLAGQMAWSNTLLLLPYLLYLWSVWYIIRLIKTEEAYDQLTENIYIGRRLLGHEFPSFIDHVVDLTCELPEPKSMRDVAYHSFQILDGFVPQTDQLKEWVSTAAEFNGTIYIHCAEGHGRTGLFAAALLVERGDFPNVDEALKFVRSKRPLVRLGTRQRSTLAAFQQT